MKYPKHEYIRSKQLLENARKIPCQGCGADDGTVVAAHCNWGHGKGRGIKADDNMIASLCFACHSEIDQGSKMSKPERMALWFDAHCMTVQVLTIQGLWPKDVPYPKGFFTGEDK